VDPVTNIMDYGDDTCASEFTAGQASVMRSSIVRYKPSLIANEPHRCVVAETRVVCRSPCFVDRMAPNGTFVPWCWTDIAGGWGACDCGTPRTLSCGKKQAREQTLRAGNLCLSAELDKVTLQSCSASEGEFQRWIFGYDGTVVSVGTGWCLTAGPKLKPCGFNAPSQIWTSARNGTMTTKNGHCLTVTPGVCQAWIRGPGKVTCSSFRTAAACLVRTRGCSCRWIKRRCIA
jgi:hypothetical protein